MKTIDTLKLQAYLDGELTASDTSQVEEALARDAFARELVGELRTTREALKANEPVAVLPESVDFHWSKIARDIERLEAAPVAAPWPSRILAWLRYFAPAAVVGAVVLIAALQFLPSGNNDEIYTESSPEVSPVVFQSHEESMSVIWLHGDVDPDPAAADDGF